MRGAVFGCPAWWARWLPGEVRRLRGAWELEERRWEVLALIGSGCGRLDGRMVSCGLLLLDGPPETVTGIQSERAVSCGLSLRDSLTLSSVRQPTLCVQRAIPRPDGGVVEPQEIPLGRLPAPADRILPLLGLRLLFSGQHSASRQDLPIGKNF